MGAIVLTSVLRQSRYMFGKTRSGGLTRTNGCSGALSRLGRSFDVLLVFFWSLPFEFGTMVDVEVSESEAWSLSRPEFVTESDDHDQGGSVSQSQQSRLVV